MGKKLYSITVRGKHKTWSFHIREDPMYISEWEQDGLEIYELLNSVPVWIVKLGLTKQFIFMQDVFNFKNPFKS